MFLMHAFDKGGGADPRFYDPVLFLGRELLNFFPLPWPPGGKVIGTELASRVENLGIDCVRFNGIREPFEQGNSAINDSTRRESLPTVCCFFFLIRLA